MEHLHPPPQPSPADRCLVMGHAGSLPPPTILHNNPHLLHHHRHHHQVHLHFPPPPNYPPPHPSTSQMEDHSMAGPSSQRHPLDHHHHQQHLQHHHEQQHQSWGEEPSLQQFHHHQDYSYAYYVPGPPTRHTNVPNKGSYHTRHTYMTRYGTEENIYEEINRGSSGSRRPQSESLMSLNQSLVEEEVRRVQSGHRRVLGELNLSVEAMLMPSGSRDGSSDGDNQGENDDQLADLLTIGPTDELLSPLPVVDLDSGFSGSSSGASYRSAGGSLRRTVVLSDAATSRPRSVVLRSSPPPRASTPLERQQQGGGGGNSGKGFWGKKAWKRITGFPSTMSLNKSRDEPKSRSNPWDSPKCTTPPGRPALQHTVSQRSSEDSWCSASEPELSSDDEAEAEEEEDRTSDRSATSSIRSNNGAQLRNSLNKKARTLCDKLRGDVSPQMGGPGGRLSRWFSIRRGSSHQYDLENVDCVGGNNRGMQQMQPSQHQQHQQQHKMPLLAEVQEEDGGMFGPHQHRRHVPPTLPPAPPNLSQQELKRRYIVSAIVHSENSYVATLQRLVNDYKKPLEESGPAILSASKITTLFHKLPEILQCHTLFRIALAESVRNWDRDEKIGDVFVASFSKAIVLDIYSGFINNFSVAMDLAKMESKRKSALADFLKVNQIKSHDRLSFFGLMVKPVQRFPQFILFLQDLLKHTPQGHHDRMSLQLALTQLESLAEMLNERKREAEQYQAFKEMLRHISGKFSVRPLSESNRYLLREDNVMQLEYNQNGMVTKAKTRRLLLLNDLVVCVSVAAKSADDFGTSERLSLKWTIPVADVEIQDTSASPTLSRVLTAAVTTKGGSIKSNGSFDGGGGGGGSTPLPQEEADNLCAEMSNLMHDYEIMSRISDLVCSLRGSYRDISLDGTRRILHDIQTSIQQKDEEMAWVDSCCLQLVARNKAGKEDVFTFKTDNPSIKKEWITELRLAQLALDPNNSPAWEVPEQEMRPSTKMPLFVRSQCVYKSQHQTEVRCGCYYTVSAPKTSSSSQRRRRHRPHNYLWICTTDGASTHIAVLSQQHHQQSGALKDITSFSLVETQVTCMEFVKGAAPPCPSLASDTVWMGTASHRLLMYAADEPEREEQVSSATLCDVITQIKYHCDDRVYVALANGCLNIYRRGGDGAWLLGEPQVLSLGVGADPVSSLLPINSNLYAACGKQVFVLNAGEVLKSFTVHEHSEKVNMMAHSGIGLWISLKHSSIICLYHTETFKHLQDINIASNVMRVTKPPNGATVKNNLVNVTSLLACKGLLWVGTNVGIALTIPLPRLEGVPIISGRVNISYHAHFGPISFLLALQPKSYYNYSNDNDNDSVSTTPKVKNTSPGIALRPRSASKDSNKMARLSKTLPRGFGTGSLFSNCSTSSSDTNNDNCTVYGLCGDLINIKDYEGEDHILTDPIYESLRRSDPELAAIPNKVSTLDRRLKMKVSRPRSLDLSNWSVDSRSSSICTSSGSEESMARHNRVNLELANQKTGGATKEAAIGGGNNGKNVNVDNTRRTVITVMGGRGYVNFRQPCCPADRSKSSFLIKESNRSDAHVVIWELKL